ncbi:MAG: endonuclease III [Dehalococcoidales bacterium]|nr:endonuclease III [Dehalococcoidales bacterium]
MVTKRPFNIDVMIERVEVAVRPFPKAALFELAEEGFSSPFEVLVACIISVRTRDEVTLAVARDLFARARTPREVAALSLEEVDGLIGLTAFHEAKAWQIAALAKRVAEEYGGRLPCDGEVLRSFVGVGPKCANLTLGIGCGQGGIGVDVHVHRVTNRWGYVATRTPEQTMAVLEERLPRHYWLDINRLLVPFGKHICTGRLPKCSTCPVLEFCRQVDVTSHR